MHQHDSTNRFSDRADNYNRYRPGYPAAIIPYLENTIGLNKKSVLADVGSGTGIFSALFSDAGYTIKGIEPNNAMRLAAEKNLSHNQTFESVNGTAEHTKLPNHCIDLITVAQAFHWFNQDEVRTEFKRILQPGGYVLLVWNILQADTAFLQGYAVFKEKYAESIKHPAHANLSAIEAFFYPNQVTTHQIENIQLRNAAGLRGLYLSSSKVPGNNSEHFEQMLKELTALYDQYAEKDLVQMKYKTILFLSKM